MKTVNVTAEVRNPSYPSYLPIGKDGLLNYDYQFCKMACSMMAHDFDSFQSLMRKMNFSENQTDGQADRESAHFKEKDCSVICPKNEVEYSMNMNSVNLKLRDVSNEPIRHCPENVTLTAVSLSVSFDKMTIEELRYQMTGIEMFSEIGGHLGLFVGASLLTIVEFYEFIWQKILKCRQCHCRKC